MTAVAARPTADDRIRAALWFAERGFGVFSVWSARPDGVCRCPDGRQCDNAGKHPITRNGFKDATTDPQRIRTLLSAGSEPNYGLVPPDGVFVLDVDGGGIQKLADLEGQYGSLPSTLRTATANGLHVYLRWPAELPRPIGMLWGYVTRWGTGKHAGYVIGPRSIHASGAVYQPADGTALEIAQLPERWAESVIQAPEPDDDDAFIAIQGGGYQIPDYGFTGSRYNEILRFIASRYMRGISKDEILAGILTVLAPRFQDPLSEPDIRTRFERAWKNTAERLGKPLNFASADVAGAAIPELAGWPEPPTAAAYHGVLGRIVDSVAHATEADPVGILGTLLAAAGAAMGHGRALYQGSPQTANLFVCLVGDTASGRKGTAGSIARDVMSAAYPEWERLIVAGLGSGEGLIAHLKRLEQAAGEDERPEHRALVMESEFGRLLTVMAREGSTLSPVVRDAWDGVPMGRFLAREQSLVTWHHVGIVAHVTPIELRAKLTNTDAANGFGNRFLWLAVRRTKLVPFPESPRTLVPAYALRQLSEAIRAAQTTAEVRWTPDAANRWEWLYATITSRPLHGLMGALVARQEAQIARLALVYALLDGADEIDVEHLEAAEAMWLYAERSVAYVFGSSTGNRDADALRDFLVDGPLDWEGAKRAVGARRSADLIDAVEVLRNLGIVEPYVLPREGGGRPRRMLRLADQTLQTLQTAQVPAQASEG